MPYHINFSAWNGVFAVPNKIVDEFLLSASGYYIKVFLFFLRHSECKIDNLEQIASATGGSVQDVKEAIGYWKTAGLVSESTDEPTYQESDRSKSSNVAVLSNRPPTISSAEVAKRVSENTGLRFLCEQVEILFGKPLTPSEQRGVITLSDWLGVLRFCRA